jgi:hypothetical protein
LTRKLASLASGRKAIRTAAPLAGAYSICYVNAFQTQPEELRWWRAHHRSLLLHRRGREVHDPGWPGEVLLDTSTARKRAAIAKVLGGWIDGCARDGALAGVAAGGAGVGFAAGAPPHAAPASRVAPSRRLGQHFEKLSARLL